jgi:DNA-binding MarR family transcriptional regulator
MPYVVTDVERSAALDALRAIVLASERYRQALAGHLYLGRTETQAVNHLAADDNLGPTDLANRLGITTGATTALIDRLEDAGLAQRTSHPSDRRRSVVSLTQQGRAVVDLGRASMDRLFADVAEEDLVRVTDALRTITQNMTRESDRLASSYADAPHQG